MANRFWVAAQAGCSAAASWNIAKSRTLRLQLGGGHGLGSSRANSHPGAPTALLVLALRVPGALGYPSDGFPGLDNL